MEVVQFKESLLPHSLCEFVYFQFWPNERKYVCGREKKYSIEFKWKLLKQQLFKKVLLNVKERQRIRCLAELFMATCMHHNIFFNLFLFQLFC